MGNSLFIALSYSSCIAQDIAQEFCFVIFEFLKPDWIQLPSVRYVFVTASVVKEMCKVAKRDIARREEGPRLAGVANLVLCGTTVVVEYASNSS